MFEADYQLLHQTFNLNPNTLIVLISNISITIWNSREAEVRVTSSDKQLVAGSSPAEDKHIVRYAL